MSHVPSLLTLLAILTTAHAATWHVSPTGSDAAAGTSSGTALRTIARAVSKAANNDTILLAAGVYSGVNNSGIALSAAKPVHVRASGGAAASQTTIIDCAPGARAFTMSDSASSLTWLTVRNCRPTSGAGGAVWVTGSSATAVFHGVHFESCSSQLTGGAVAVVAGRAQFTSCRFDNNSATVSSAGALMASLSTVTVSSCTFTNNVASTGGAILLQFSTATISDSSLTNNSATLNGGAVAATSTSLTLSGNTWSRNVAGAFGSAAHLSSCGLSVRGDTFSRNKATQSGGLLVIYTMHQQTQHIDNCTFEYNEAGDRGAGLYGADESLILVTNSTFRYNKAVQGGGVNLYHCADGKLQYNTYYGNDISGDGAGVYARCENKNVSISDSHFYSNVANRGGAIYVCSKTTAIFARLSLRANKASKGGGLYFSKSMTAVYAANVTFDSNIATLRGGGFTGDSLEFDMRHSTFLSNTAPLGAAIYLQKEVPVSHAMTGLTFASNVASTPGAVAALYFEQLRNSALETMCKACLFKTAVTVDEKVTTDPAELRLDVAPPTTGMYSNVKYPVRASLYNGIGNRYVPSTVNARITVTAREVSSAPSAAADPSTSKEFKITSGQSFSMSDDTSDAAAVDLVVLGRFDTTYELTFTVSTSRGTVPPVRMNVTILSCGDDPRQKFVRAYHPANTQDYSVCVPPLPIKYVSKGAYIGTAVLAAVAMVATAGLFKIVHDYGHTPVFKSASVPFLKAMIAGAVPIYILVLIMGLDVWDPSRSYTVLCPVQPLLASVSFALVFGSVLVRTQRIADIFLAKRLKINRRKVQNKHLGKVLLAMVVYEVIFNVLWAIINPLKVELVEQGGALHQVCRSDNMGTWRALSFLSKGLMIARGLQLAVSVRNVASAFNESKQIALAVYNTTIMLAMAVPLIASVGLGTPAHVATAVFLVIGVLCPILIVILPKAYIALYQPEANVATTASSHSSMSRSGVSRRGKPINMTRTHLGKSAGHNSSHGSRADVPSRKSPREQQQSTNDPHTDPPHAETSNSDSAHHEQEQSRDVHDVAIAVADVDTPRRPPAVEDTNTTTTA